MNLKRIRKNVVKKWKKFNETVSIKRKISLIVFALLTLGLLFHSIILTMFYIDNNYQFKVFNHSYIAAVLSDQDTTDTMYTGVVKVSAYSFDHIEIGDQVIVWSDFNIDEYFVHYVNGVNEGEKTIDTGYTTTVANEISNERIVAVYESNANLIGSLYYSSLFTRGYIFLLLSHLLFGLGYYYIFIYDHPKRFFNKSANQKDIQ
jgi:hypothetical protein